MMKEINGRKILFSSVCGSYNYNLNEENSDKDYHMFLLPTREDMFTGQMYSASNTTPTLDYASWDIRTLPEKMWKANPNVIEMFYSVETSIMDDKFREPVNILFDMRDDIAQMNLKYMWKASKGIIMSEIKDLERRNPDLLQEFGYNTKVAMHAKRTMRVVRMFADGRFADAFRCNDSERNDLLRIKHGEVYDSAKDARECLTSDLDELSSEFSGMFESAEPHRETYELVKSICMAMVDKHYLSLIEYPEVYKDRVLRTGLKPCPVCNGSLAMYKNRQGTHSRFWVECENCGYAARGITQKDLLAKWKKPQAHYEGE